MDEPMMPPPTMTTRARSGIGEAGRTLATSRSRFARRSGVAMVRAYGIPAASAGSFRFGGPTDPPGLRVRVGRRTIERMRRIRSPWARAFLTWSIILLVATLVVAADASIGLNDAQQACFFQTAPCPDGRHPKVVQLQFAFLGMPLIWLAGVMLGVV